MSTSWMCQRLRVLLCSTYHVVVVEEDGSRQVRRRELGHLECYPSPSSHGESPGGGASGTPTHYYAAELPPSSLPEATPFTVGDNHTYNGYWNTPLDPSKNYLIYFQASSNFRGVSHIIHPTCLLVSLSHIWLMIQKRSQRVVHGCIFRTRLGQTHKMAEHVTLLHLATNLHAFFTVHVTFLLCLCSLDNLLPIERITVVNSRIFISFTLGQGMQYTCCARKDSFEVFIQETFICCHTSLILHRLKRDGSRIETSLCS